MYKQLLFGQYVHKQSIIHQLDPRVKIAALFILSLSVFFLKSFAQITVFSIVVFIMLMLAKLNIKALIKNLRPFFFIFIFILLMYMLFSRNKLDEGILTIIKFILFIVISSIVTYSTTITDLLAGFEKLLKPLEIVRINPKTVALLLSLTIRFIPTLFLYAERINEAQKARLGNVRKRKFIETSMFKMLDRMFKSASTVSDAIIARNYTPKRTSYLTKLELKKSDYIAVTCLAVIIIVTII